MLKKINISPDKQKFIVYAFLALATIAVYWQVNQYNFVNLDDNKYVTENTHVRSGITLNGLRWAFTTTHGQYWHPVTWLSLMLDYKLFGLNAGGYHSTNVLLHIFSALLLFMLFCRMTGAIWKSAFVAFFFALHPLHVESVAWIAKRRDLLCVLFTIITLCLYVYYIEKPVIKRYLLALFIFALALMSKPMAVSLPLIMILLDYWPLKRFDSHKGNLILWQIKEKTPFIVLSAVFSVITVHARDFSAMKHFSFSSRISNALVSFVTYLEQILWPHDMSILRLFPENIPAWQIIYSALLIVVVSVFVIEAAKRLPYLFAGWLWYAISIGPTLGIIQYGHLSMSDHHTYLPSIGISIMLAWGVPFFIKKEAIRKCLFPAVVVFIAVLSFMTWKQCGYWRDSLEIWNHTLKITKGNYLAHNNLGLALFNEGKIMEAIDQYNKAIKMKPDYVYSYPNRGIAYARLGQYQRAMEDFDETILRNPNYAEAYLNKGAAYGERGQYQSAIENFSKAISIRSDYTNAYFNRGITYFRLGMKEPGCYDAQRVCELEDCRLLESAKANGYCP